MDFLDGLTRIGESSRKKPDMDSIISKVIKDGLDTVEHVDILL